MKLALVLDRFERGRGGLENWAWDWTRWLLDRGHAVHVVASTGRRDFDTDRFTMAELGFAPSRVAMGEKAARHLDTVAVDLIHDLGVGWRYDILQPQFGSRLADDRRNLRSLPAARRWLALPSRRRRRRLADIRALERRQYVDHPGHVVAVSAMTRDDLRRWHGVAEERITVIHNGIDAERFKPADPEERRRLRSSAGLDGRIVLLFAAHNFRLKGLATTMRALGRLARPQFHLVVAGHGATDRYRALARRLGIADRVSFAGFVPDIRDTYAMADAFVQPTFYDPCSLAILEAAATGLAVVTSRFNGASELFVDGHSASIVRDPEDAVEVARRIGELADPARRTRLAAGGLVVAGAATAEGSFARLFEQCVAVAEARNGRPCRA
jgi:UDP-glucose:(heptosyl)LPS alpha-1,3-glucosyltransferase